MSCDGFGDKDVISYIKSLNWNRGNYDCVVHQSNLGVDAHNIWAIQKATELDNCLILEDDLMLAPVYADYIASTQELWERHDIGGISLYRYTFREVDHMPFVLLPSDEFVYYQQRPSSKGCFYTKEMAKEFLNFNVSFNGDLNSYTVPSNVYSWGNEVWERSFYAFLISKHKFLAFPKYSLVTDYGETGVHMQTNIHRYIHHSPLYFGDSFHLKLPEDCLNRYDAFYELLPEVFIKAYDTLASYDFEVDLAGTKQLEHFTKAYAITSKSSTAPIISWGRVLKPEAVNVLYKQEGDFFRLSKVTDLRKTAKRKQWTEQFYYYFPDARLTDLIKYKCAEVWSRFFN